MYCTYCIFQFHWVFAKSSSRDSRVKDHSRGPFDCWLMIHHSHLCVKARWLGLLSSLPSHSHSLSLLYSLPQLPTLLIRIHPASNRFTAASSPSFPTSHLPCPSPSSCRQSLFHIFLFHFAATPCLSIFHSPTALLSLPQLVQPRTNKHFSSIENTESSPQQRRRSLLFSLPPSSDDISSQNPKHPRCPIAKAVVRWEDTSPFYSTAQPKRRPRGTKSSLEECALGFLSNLRFLFFPHTPPKLFQSYHLSSNLEFANSRILSLSAEIS